MCKRSSHRRAAPADDRAGTATATTTTTAAAAAAASAVPAVAVAAAAAAAAHAKGGFKENFSAGKEGVTMLKLKSREVDPRGEQLARDLEAQRFVMQSRSCANQVIAPSFVVQEFEPEFATAPEARSFARSRVRSFVRSLVRSFARSLARSLVRSLARKRVRSFVRSLARSFARSLVRPPVVIIVCR